MATASGYVEPFSAPSPDAARLGGKGASLARLVGLGHRVPPGFTVTVGGFMSTLDHLGLMTAFEDLSEALASGGDLSGGKLIAAGLMDGRLPERLQFEIVNEVDGWKLWEQNPDGLIVRSSATVEDSAAHSFAGIFESIAIDRPDRLEPTIREVWASVFAPRALAYAREAGMTNVPTMAVVVQRFLEAERSGVMFTRFDGPEGEHRILVEHVEGGCEKLVKGEVTPERLWLSPGEVVGDDLGGPLAPAHARELARLAKSLETSFGSPQDVEWCVYEDEVHVVQSRPITTSFAATRPSVGATGVDPILTGTGASPGAGSGQVHLVFNIEQALALRTGHVLVTPMTNPDMVVAMRNSAAIVTDVGGMICHAAIVSRELGLPCVVGTETATRTLEAGRTVTVDGSSGAVYDGMLAIQRPGEGLRPAGWDDLWTLWASATEDRADLVPVVSSIAALEAMPPDTGVPEVVLVPDLDLRADRYGLWFDLEGLAPEDRVLALDDYVGRAAGAAAEAGLTTLRLHPIGSLSHPELAAAVERAGDARLVGPTDDDQRDTRGPVVPSPSGAWPPGPAAVPLSAAARIVAPTTGPAAASEQAGVGPAIAAALDTITFFGHRPGVKVTTMPDPASRTRWWAVLPEYHRFHAEYRTPATTGEFEWLEVRPELVISALLKSLVQPGFEMVPRVMGFAAIPPMHIKWVKCRYHFRSDTFGQVWEAIVRATWDEAAMVDLMRRVRESYVTLREVLALFPSSDEELRAADGPRMVALITSWWPRWVEFFALCWFIQAQGDDIAYPFVHETVESNLASLAPSGPGGFAWPPVTDLVAPTTPVMSGEYMASVGALREALLAAGLDSTSAAMSALGRGEHPDIGARLAAHLGAWGWMRDRDLLFEPWDTPERVIDTALRTERHDPSPYAENLRRNLLALSFHVDLAVASGRASALNHHARFLHDLNVERENHHVLWLKYSYPLRRLVLELERRLVEAGSLVPGDVFFLQAPELIEAAKALPSPLPAELIAKVRNRRAGYLKEAKLPPVHDVEPVDEDDYY